MPYELEYSSECGKQVKNLCAKNAPLRKALKNKLSQILGNPHHFKPLKRPLNNLRRVHILNSFVLIYEVIEGEKTVRLLRFSHHDDAY